MNSRQELRGITPRRAFNVYVRPRIGKVAIYDLKRRDIVEMLDAIEDENGPVMADREIRGAAWRRLEAG
jgi:hypothetical protein